MISEKLDLKIVDMNRITPATIYDLSIPSFCNQVDHVEQDHHIYATTHRRLKNIGSQPWTSACYRRLFGDAWGAEWESFPLGF